MTTPAPAERPVETDLAVRLASRQVRSDGEVALPLVSESERDLIVKLLLTAPAGASPETITSTESSRPPLPR